MYAETPANPILRLTDVAAVAEVAHAAGAKLAVDSTFATPVAIRPLDLGADFVLHSLTKYIGGHGDAVGGALLGAEPDMTQIRRGPGVHIGGVLSPFNAWLIMRGIATLPIRMRAHEEGALTVARFLEGHPQGDAGALPGPAVAPAARPRPATDVQLRRHGLVPGRGRSRHGGEARAGPAHGALRGVPRPPAQPDRVLADRDLLATSFRMDAAQEEAYRAYAGDGLFRLSVGLEDAADIIADLEQALE